MRLLVGFILIGLLSLSTVNATLVGGFDQRYESTNYTIGSGIWVDSTGAANATTTNPGTFTATTTPNGTFAVANATPGVNNVFSFTRASELGSAGQLTVQSVVRIDGSQDDRSGPFALAEAGGWSGLFAGANADGNNSLRGGNVGATNQQGTSLIDSTTGAAVAAGTWGVYTLTVDATAVSPQFTATFTDLITGATLFTTSVDVGAISNGSLDLANAGVLFGGEQGGGAAATNGFQGAIADVVVYNSLLDSNDIAANITEFQNLFVIPEPSTVMLLGIGLLTCLASHRRRR